MVYVGLLSFLLFYIYAVIGTFLFGAKDPMHFVSYVLPGTTVMLNLFIGVVVNGMHETQREQELAVRRQHLDQLGQLTLGDEMKLIEHELDKLKEQMQALRLRTARGPEREIHAGHRLPADAPALPETQKPPHP